MEHTSLRDHLASFIPLGYDLDFYHISTPPTLCAALNAPPPGQKPVKTYCEQHFLNAAHVTDRTTSRRIAVFAIEIYIYTTDTLTTIFISKADSTGFAYLLELPVGYRSLSRLLASAFVDYLVHNRTRKDRKLNVSLFARAQGQYLFPGSVEHGKKHVLSDRALVKWWCNTLDPILRRHPHPKVAGDGSRAGPRLYSQAYLIVPGHDLNETTGFLPASARTDPLDLRRWKNDHPLREITSYPGAAPRSIVPHFPDDPKSRFLLDLDDELADAPPSGQVRAQPSPSKRGNGQWKSVKTLDQFWEMMAYRQECSSGRLVGFIWVMFVPVDLTFRQTLTSPPSPSLRPRKRKFDEISQKPTVLPRKKKRMKRAHKYWMQRTGFIAVRPPRAKTAEGLATMPAVKTTFWFWPVESRGSIVVGEKAYARLIKILHRLDFASLESGIVSTEKWARETALIAGAPHTWSWRVSGTMPIAKADRQTDPSQLEQSDTGAGPGAHSDRSVNMLELGMVRKKAKPSAPGPAAAPTPAVNNLTGLIRRKAKP